ncbi:MAG: MGMT family protein [Gemmiger sp.]
MADENRKDFNAMLAQAKDMPRIQILTDETSIRKYGGARMYFAPPAAYDAAMRRVPFGRLTTVGALRELFAQDAGADFTDPITAGIFVSIAAWASFQRMERGDGDETPWWRTLKAGGELNPKYPGGAEEQKARLEAEGHTVLAKGRKNIRYYVKNYERAMVRPGPG